MKFKSIVIGGIAILSLIGMTGCSLDNANEVKVFDKQSNVIGSNNEENSNQNVTFVDDESNQEKNNVDELNQGKNNVDELNQEENKSNSKNTTGNKVVDVSFNLVNEELSYAIIWGYDANGDVVWKYQTKKDYVGQYENARYLGTRGNNVYILDLGILRILDLQTGIQKTSSEEQRKNRILVIS